MAQAQTHTDTQIDLESKIMREIICPLTQGDKSKQFQQCIVLERGCTHIDAPVVTQDIVQLIVTHFKVKQVGSISKGNPGYHRTHRFFHAFHTKTSPQMNQVLHHF